MRRLIVAIVALAVLGGVYVVLQRRQAEDERRERAEATLLRYDQRSVRALTIAVRGEPYRFERTDDGWWLVEPVLDRAEEPRLAELMTLSRRSAVLVRIDDPESPAAYGLTPPTVELSFEGVDAPPLRVGSVSPDGRGVYARLGGSEEILLIEATAGGPFTDPDIEQFREASVTGVARAAVTEVRVQPGTGADLRLVREADGWWLVSDGRRPAFDGAVARLLEALESAEIVRFVDGADASDPAFGLGPEATTVELSTGETDRVVRVGGATVGGERYVQRSDRSAILVAQGIDLEAVTPDRADLLDRKLTKVNRYKVRRVEYRRGQGTVTLVRSEDGWTADGRAVAEDRVFAFLARLVEAPVSGWADREPPSEPAAAMATYVLDDGTEGRVRFWDDGTAAVDAVSGAVATLRSSAPELPEL